MKSKNLKNRFQELAGIKSITEASFDDKLKGALGMDDEEFEEKITSRDIGSPFPDTDVMKDFDEDDVRNIEDKAMKSDSQRYMVDIILPIDVPESGDEYEDEKVAEKIADFYRKKMSYPEAYTGKADKRLRLR